MDSNEPQTSNSSDENNVEEEQTSRKFSLKIGNKILVLRVAKKEDLVNNHYFCKQCSDQYFNKFSEFKSHIKLHEREQAIKQCEQCNIKFISNQALIIHQRNFHGETFGFKCNICEKQFTTNQYLNLHIKTHEVGDRFYCQKCGHWYRSKEELVEHNVYCDKHQNKCQHSCEFCHKTFKYPRDKILHERSHTGFKPFVCQYCNSRFSQLSALTTHLRQHTNKRIYKCRFCSASYTDSSATRRHELTSHYKQCQIQSNE